MTMSKGKVTTIQLTIYNRRQKLLDMLYTPSELSQTLGITTGYIYKCSGQEELAK